MEAKPPGGHIDMAGDPATMAGFSETYRTISVRGTGFAPEKTADLVRPPRSLRIASESSPVRKPSTARHVGKAALKQSKPIRKKNK